MASSEPFYAPFTREGRLAHTSAVIMAWLVDKRNERKNEANNTTGQPAPMEDPSPHPRQRAARQCQTPHP